MTADEHALLRAYQKLTVRGRRRAWRAVLDELRRQQREAREVRAKRGKPRPRKTASTTVPGFRRRAPHPPRPTLPTTSGYMYCAFCGDELMCWTSKASGGKPRCSRCRRWQLFHAAASGD